MITWIDGDDNTLKTDLFEYDTTPSYTGETPTKTGDAQYSYTFTGWLPEITTVTGDQTYTAQFTQTVNKYTVTWKNADGTTLETDENVPYGTTPTYDGATPTKATDDKYSYAFTDWDKEITAVTGDVTYTAQYSSTPNTYTVTLDALGGQIGSGNVTSYTYGTSAVLPTIVTKAHNTFAGWYDNSGYQGDPVTEISTADFGNKTFYAKWEPYTYTVHFDKNYDNVGGTMADQSFTYDEEAKALTANAFHSTTGEFIKWNTEPDGSGKDFADGERVQNLTEENGGTVTLYAQWHKQYRIFYDDSILVCAVNGNDNEKYWAYQGDTVRINVVDNTHEYTISVVDENGESIDYDADSYTFVMPEGKVWITTTSVKRIVYTDILLDNFDSWEDVAYIYDAAHPTVTPSVTVKDGETTLTENTDYTLSITNNTGSPTEMVTAVVTITGIGGYVGTNTKEFRISPFNIADCKLKGRLEAYVDGYGVYYPLCNNVEVWSGDTQLEIDNDYNLELIYPESGEFEVGQTYQAIIKGSGDWGGTKTFEFTVIELAHTVVFDPNGGTGEIASDTATKGQHYYLPECTFTAPAGFAFDHWEVSCEPGEEKQPDDYFTAPYIWSESDVQTITVKAVWKDITGAQLEGYSLSIQEDGDIGVNFYMSLSDDILSKKENAKMRFVIPIKSKTGETKTLDMDIPTSTELGGKTYYVFKCPVAAKEMTATITAQMYVDGVATGREYTYTVRDYAEYLISNAYEADGTTVKNQEYVNALPLVQAMLHYGASAQTLFNNNTNELANKNVEYTGGLDADGVKAAVKSVIDNGSLTNLDTTPVADGLSFYGASLNLGSKTAYTIYYEKGTDYSSETPPAISCEKEGITVSVKERTVDGKAMVLYVISGISAGNLLDSIDITIGCTSLKVNTATFMYAVLNSTDAQYNNLKNTVVALYNFNKEATTYTGTEGN